MHVRYDTTPNDEIILAKQSLYIKTQIYI